MALVEEIIIATSESDVKIAEIWRVYTIGLGGLFEVLLTGVTKNMSLPMENA
ncbi:hypothetical protein [Roseibium sp.]|uniref:hypothetical protein n=1 Tax=Roseibium sp. TaxID=1936156 RepID=UPI003D0A126D